ncbi:hypothetical protein D3C73_1522610 [compost metagenome]
MLGDVVFVGEQNGRDCRVVLVGKPCIAVDVGHVAFSEALHGLGNGDVDVGIALYSGNPLLFGQFIEGVNVVVGGQDA